MILVNNLTRSRINVRKLELKVFKTLKFLGVLKTWRLELYFLDSRKMAFLHKKLLKKPGPATVISVETGKGFKVGEFAGGGEIYLCSSEIKKSGLPLDYFLVHGILHLFGFDHKTPRQAGAMLAKEKELCDKIKA
ncbi:MAG: putative rRNA maturation factor [Parcubacteria group bacterium GW2011_GWB1_45_10]|nr:MAG: putative rRNA maturation factor [Parcubacteria group bacterium GW2011_GWB1_45_10]